MPRDLQDLRTVRPPDAVAPDWYAITAEATGEGESTRARVRIYDTIGGWFGTNAAEFVGELDALDVDELEVHINSPGGAVWDGLAIMNALKQHRARVTIIVDGLAASAASIIAMAGDEVVMAEGSQMMIHRASGGAWGNAAFLRDTAAILDKIDGNLAGIYARRAGGTRESWLELMTAETWYDAAEAVEAGLADRADDSLEGVDAEASFDLSIFNYAGRSHAPTPRRPGEALRPVAAMPPTGAHEAGLPADLPQAPVSSEPGNHNRKEEPLMEEFLNNLRQRLGVNSEASVEDILAALDEALAERADETAPTASIPEGTVLVDAGRFAELEAQAAAGAQARAQQDAERRDRLVATALTEGRISAANRAVWRERLDADEDGTTALLATLPKSGAVPTEEIGYTGGEDESSEDSLYASLYPSTKKES